MKWVLVDLSFLAHRARSSMEGLSHEDIPTGVIFGVFEQLASICKDSRVKSNRLVVFADSKKSLRKQAYPQYKQKRAKDLSSDEIEKRKCMDSQVIKLRRYILPSIGIPVYGQAGLESDDLMAYASQQITKMGGRGVLITSDGDLFQSITDNVNWLDPQRDLYYTRKSFIRQKGIDPRLWWKVKCLAGCKSDTIKGISGVGEHRAVDYLLKKLPRHYAAHQTILSPEGREIIKRNQELIKLPHAKTKAFRLRSPVYNSERMLEICDEFGMFSYLEDHNKFSWFHMKEQKQRRRNRG